MSFACATAGDNADAGDATAAVQERVRLRA